MWQRHSSLSGFVLAGGESRRMGQPKHLLALGGEIMLERQMRLLRSVCRVVGVVGLSEFPPDPRVAVLPDAVPERGPLGGIYTGLLRTRTEYNLFVGCDLPFLDARFLGYLARLALDGQTDITVPECKQGRVEPLCAIYRRGVRAVVRARLREGANKTSGFFSRVRCRVVPWREIARAGFTSHIFDNMNTPEDWQAAVRHFSAGGSGALEP